MKISRNCLSQASQSVIGESKLKELIMTDEVHECPDEVDLLDVIGHDKVTEDYCDRFYWEWENKVAKPALEALGYTDVVFSMGEQDSFGPLSRVVHAKKDDVVSEFYYG